MKLCTFPNVVAVAPAESVVFCLRADESLDEMEKNPNKATQAIWRASQSPVGEAAAAGVRGAAELTLSAGMVKSPHLKGQSMLSVLGCTLGKLDFKLSGLNGSILNCISSFCLV